MACERQSDFNSRPCGRGDIRQLAGAVYRVYFNSRPCGRGDTHVVAVVDGDWLISIHAPAGGATDAIYKQTRVCIISIHAPAGGATYRSEGCQDCRADFNSRPCGRGDELSQLHGGTAMIFQFTPLREGRHQRLCQHRTQNHFNSRPCGRGDGDELLNCIQPILFQFTPLREGRPLLDHNLDGNNIISIHAPAGGATCQHRPKNCPRQISIHAPAGGATFSLVSTNGVRPDFNSRPCGRGDQTMCGRSISATLFQFTPLREGRHLP